MSDSFTISEAALLTTLADLRGATIVTLEARTEKRLLAKHPDTGAPNPHKGTVIKIARVNGMIGWQYAKTVNRQRTREQKPADFHAIPRAWGRRIPHCPLVEHKGRHYLELKGERTLDHRYETRAGQPLPLESVEPYLPKPSNPRQGLDREIFLRDYALASILSIKLSGTTLIISRPPDAPQAG